jgi:dynein light intermediate chain 1
MLDGVSSGKRLPEKSLLVLGIHGAQVLDTGVIYALIKFRTGGTPDTQKDFLESLSTDPSSNRRPPDRGRKPPIANQFALGYTYQDVLDADHEGISFSMPQFTHPHSNIN